jgi:hypothetical protein
VFPLPLANTLQKQSNMSFKTLVRFENASGQIRYGDLGNASAARDLEGAEVELLDGDVDSGFKATGKKDKIHKVEMTASLFCNIKLLTMRSCYAHSQKHLSYALA